MASPSNSPWFQQIWSDCRVCEKKRSKHRLIPQFRLFWSPTHENPNLSQILVSKIEFLSLGSIEIFSFRLPLILQQLTFPTKNISPQFIAGKGHNFNKYPRSVIDSLGTPYDYRSVMHYDDKAFSNNPRLPTIVTKDRRVCYYFS